MGIRRIRKWDMLCTCSVTLNPISSMTYFLAAALFTMWDPLYEGLLVDLVGIACLYPSEWLPHTSGAARLLTGIWQGSARRLAVRCGPLKASATCALKQRNNYPLLFSMLTVESVRHLSLLPLHASCDTSHL
jgi:hypothetical protein